MLVITTCELGTIHLVSGIAPRKVSGCVATAKLFSLSLEAFEPYILTNLIQKEEDVLLEVRR